MAVVNAVANSFSETPFICHVSPGFLPFPPCLSRVLRPGKSFIMVSRALHPQRPTLTLPRPWWLLLLKLPCLDSLVLSTTASIIAFVPCDPFPVQFSVVCLARLCLRFVLQITYGDPRTRMPHLHSPSLPWSVHLYIMRECLACTGLAAQPNCSQS